jgi:hypothetical protein
MRVKIIRCGRGDDLSGIANREVKSPIFEDDTDCCDSCSQSKSPMSDIVKNVAALFGVDVEDMPLSQAIALEDLLGQLSYKDEANEDDEPEHSCHCGSGCQCHCDDNDTNKPQEDKPKVYSPYPWFNEPSPCRADVKADNSEEPEMGKDQPDSEFEKLMRTLVGPDVKIRVLDPRNLPGFIRNPEAVTRTAEKKENPLPSSSQNISVKDVIGSILNNAGKLAPQVPVEQFEKSMKDGINGCKENVLDAIKDKISKSVENMSWEETMKLVGYLNMLEGMNKR